MRKTILIVNFLALCTLSLAANFVLSPVDTHAQSSQASDQQADRGVSQLAPQTGDIRAGRGTYFAVVRHNGSLARGTEVVDVTHVFGTAQYMVTFNADVRKCAYTGTVSSHPSVPGLIQVFEGPEPRQVLVYAYGANGASADLGFHLLVNCS